jgi:hypothetical protein
MQPIFDNVEFLMGLTSKDKKSRPLLRELVDMHILQIEPLTYIRGRSIPSQYMIVDEAQNLTPHEVKTIITRAVRGRRSCSRATRTRSTIRTWTRRTTARARRQSVAGGTDRRTHHVGEGRTVGVGGDRGELAVGSVVVDECGDADGVRVGEKNAARFAVCV